MARPPAEQTKEICADGRYTEQFGSVAADQGPGAKAVRRDVSNSQPMLFQEIEDGRRHLWPAASHGRARAEGEDDNPLGIRVGQRFQQNRIHHREDGGARPETERQRRDRGQREAKRPREAANGHP